MTIQSAHVNISRAEMRVQTNWLQRIEPFILFLICEAVIVIFGSHYFDVFPTNKNLTFNLSISVIFLIISLWFRIDKRWNMYWQIAFAFFIASAAIPFTAYFDPFVLIFFFMNTLTLGLACGYLMMKSDNRWGTFIIHAASDFFLFLVVLANA